MMALSTIASSATPTTARASYLHSQGHILSHKERLHLPGKRAVSPLSSSSSVSSLPLRSFPAARRNGRVARIACEAKNAVDGVLAVDDKNWDNLVIASGTLVVVDFWAPWCGPCRMIAPIIDELAKEYAGKIACYKVNTDDCPNIASKYGIRSIPTVLFFKNGEKKESVIGAVPKSTLSTTIEKYIG